MYNRHVIQLSINLERNVKKYIHTINSFAREFTAGN